MKKIKGTDIKIGDKVKCRGCGEVLVMGGKSHFCSAFFKKLNGGNK